jgi:hypothetical protein
VMIRAQKRAVRQQVHDTGSRNSSEVSKSAEMSTVSKRMSRIIALSRSEPS